MPLNFIKLDFVNHGKIVKSTQSSVAEQRREEKLCSRICYIKPINIFVITFLSLLLSDQLITFHFYGLTGTYESIMWRKHLCRLSLTVVWDRN